MQSKWNKEKVNLENYILIQKLSYEKIGRKYKCSGSNIKKVAKKLGIPLVEKRKINPNEDFSHGKNRSGLKSYQDFCPNCGKPKLKTSKLCNNCFQKSRLKIGNKTLGYFINGKTHLTTVCNEIRRNAWRIMKDNNIEKCCAYCHNHEYDSIVEVHHIKGILQFSNTAKISEINDINNLVYLCPNHHKMLEKGLIKL